MNTLDYLEGEYPAGKLSNNGRVLIENPGMFMRGALSILLKCFPDALIFEQVDRFFEDVIDSDMALKDPCLLDEFINNIAVSLKSKFPSKKLEGQSDKKIIRDALKKYVLESGTLNFLYKNKQEALIRAIRINLKNNEARRKKFLMWLLEAAKALEAFNAEDIEDIILFKASEEEKIDLLKTKTLNLAVPLFLMDILSPAMLIRSPILIEMDLIIYKILREI